MNWEVTQVIQMTDKISVRLEAPGAHPVRMIWNGATRTYEYDGTGMLVERKYHAALLRALRNYFVLANQSTKPHYHKR
jgi:hypothetical protein